MFKKRREKIFAVPSTDPVNGLFPGLFFRVRNYRTAFTGELPPFLGGAEKKGKSGISMCRNKKNPVLKKTGF